MKDELSLLQPSAHIPFNFSRVHLSLSDGDHKR